tara:strand:- start:296 stop:547 length:252 start_codon:yes stop_codon:yes gene_type:complete
MGKHLKTSMDMKVIDYLAIEVYKLDPENAVLKKFLGMDNFEGTEMQKTIREFKKTGQHPDHYNTDGTWKYESGRISIEDFLKE